MLEGTLDTFTLPEIFQLLAFTRKTGCLHLQRDGGSGRVWLQDGDVYYAIASSGRLMLGKRLVGAGLVTTDQVREALEQQRDRQGTRLGRILLDRGAIDRATLETFVREQIQDSIFDLMRWTDGSFRFEHPIDTDETIGLSVSVENLIMEGSRRLEEWDAVRRRIPGRDAVVDMAPAPGEDGVEVNLQPEEWRLLALVDGRRTVGDLVDLSGQGEFVTCKLLYGLIGAGLLEIRDPALEGSSSIAALLEQQELLRQLEDADEAPVAATAPEAAPPVDELPEEPPAGLTDAADLAGPIGAQIASPQAVDEVAVDEEPEFDLPDEAFERSVADEVERVEEVAGTPGEEPPPASDDQPRQERIPRSRGRRITTDPDVDLELLDRLIDGVRGL